MRSSSLTIAALLITSVASAPTPWLPEHNHVTSLEARDPRTLMDTLRSFGDKVKPLFRPKSSGTIDTFRYDRETGAIKKESLADKLFRKPANALSDHFDRNKEVYVLSAIATGLGGAIGGSIAIACAAYKKQEKDDIKRLKRQIKKCEEQVEKGESPDAPTLDRRDLDTTDEVLWTRSPKSQSRSSSRKSKNMDPLKKKCKKSGRPKEQPRSKHSLCNPVEEPDD